MSMSRSKGHVVSTTLLVLSVLFVLLAWVAMPLLVFLLEGHADVLLKLDPTQFFSLAGTLVGGSLALLTLAWPVRKPASFEAWLGPERWGWLLIACSMLLWSLGESFRLYILSRGQQTFPSFADIGYALFLFLLFVGLMLQPSATTGTRRPLVLLDILVWIGPILIMALPLYIGLVTHSLFTAASIDPAAGLKLYYLVADAILLGCIAFVLLRSPGRNYQVTARRPVPFFIAPALFLLAASDFLAHIYPVASTPLNVPTIGLHVLISWHALGWLIGMLLLGLAATLRRLLPVTSPERLEQRLRRRRMRAIFGPIQLVPYIPLTLFLLLLVLNLFTTPASRQNTISMIMLAVTITLLILRQLLYLRENGRLIRVQKDISEQDELEKRQRDLEQRLLETRSHAIEQRNFELTTAISHLKEVLARLANGDLRARSRIVEGELLPLATSFNLMADRLAYLEQTLVYAQQLVKSLNELSAAIEEFRTGALDYVAVPTSCRDTPEVDRLVLALGLRYNAANALPPLSTAIRDEQPMREGARTTQVTSQPLPDYSAQRLSNALADLAGAIECYRAGNPFALAPDSSSIPEMQRLLFALGLAPQAAPAASPPAHPAPVAPPPAPAEQPIAAEARLPRRPRMQPIRMDEGS